MLFKIYIEEYKSNFKICTSEVGGQFIDILYRSRSKAQALGEYQRLLKNISEDNFVFRKVGDGLETYAIIETTKDFIKEIREYKPENKGE